MEQFFSKQIDQLLQATSKRPLAAHFHELRRGAKALKWGLFSGADGGHGEVLLRTDQLTILKSHWDGHEVLALAHDVTHAAPSGSDDRVPFAQPAVISFRDQIDDGRCIYSGKLVTPVEITQSKPSRNAFLTRTSDIYENIFTRTKETKCWGETDTVSS